jgi:hypothetical protein
MQIFVIMCSGEYRETINGTPEAAQRVELVAAFSDQQKALNAVESGAVDVKEPDHWGVRVFDIHPVEAEIA